MNTAVVIRFLGVGASSAAACVVALCAGTTASAAGVDPGSLVGKCQAAVQRIFPGKVENISAKQENRHLVYEFEGTAPDGGKWRAECNAITLKVTETEREVAATDPAFAKQVKVDEATARGMSVSAFPGKVVATRHIIESGGAAVYEFDIATGQGALVRIEVDATSGALVEVNPVIWSISAE
ncbi:MAG TPA: PepSY domain-containing protein [Burkholderiales bacterium]|jgi:uncharacterized membrane protein YkoI